MSGKKTAPWRAVLLGVLLTAAVDLAGILLITQLVLRGVLREENVLWALALLGLCAALLGGVPAGRGKLGATGALLSAGAYGVLLLLVGLGVWDDVTVRGLIRMAAVLAGGVLAAVVAGKVGKRRGKRLVKSNKKSKLF